MSISKDVMAALTEVAMKQCETLATDLEMFAKYVRTKICFYHSSNIVEIAVVHVLMYVSYMLHMGEHWIFLILPMLMYFVLLNLLFGCFYQNLSCYDVINIIIILPSINFFTCIFTFSVSPIQTCQAYHSQH